MNTDSYIHHRTSTLDLDSRERAEFWSEHVRVNHCLFDYRFPGGGRDFHGATEVQRARGFQLVEFWSDGIDYVRSVDQIRRDPNDDYRLLVPYRGDLSIRKGSGLITLGRGTAGLMSTRTPFELIHGGAVRAVVLTIPAATADRVYGFTPGAKAFDLGKGLGVVLDSILRTLASERDHFTANDFETACEHVVELTSALTGRAQQTTPETGLAAVEASVRRYARLHSDVPSLNGGAIARELGWSLRQVQLALQAGGTSPRELIREERLRQARRRLLDPSLYNLSIAEVSFASGFSSLSNFGSVFHQRFGVSPRELREHGHTCHPAER
jgi:AraC-like DNA-binding protein